MASTPLKKKEKKTSVLWEHARKVFRENGSVKHVKCKHCEKTFSYVGASTSNALNHVLCYHQNQAIASLDSKNKPSHTYELKCEIKQKLKDGIERTKTQKDYDDDVDTLSKWSKSTNKMIGEVNGKIQPVPDENKDDDNDDGDDDDDDGVGGDSYLTNLLYSVMCCP